MQKTKNKMQKTNTKSIQKTKNKMQKTKANKYIKRYFKNSHELCFICYDKQDTRILTNICDCKLFIHDTCLASVIVNLGSRCKTCQMIYFSQHKNIKKKKTHVSKIISLLLTNYTQPQNIKQELIISVFNYLLLILIVTSLLSIK